MLKIDPSQRSMPEINPVKVCFLVEKTRSLRAQDEGAPTDASKPTDDDEIGALSESAYAALQEEITQFIDDLDEDEAAALVALTWIGRGDFEPEDWRSAVTAAQERREGPTSAYLLGVTLLPDYLEEALSAYGCSCRDYNSSDEDGGG